MAKKKAKKRGVKPGTKRGPYKKLELGIGDKIKEPTLYQQLDNEITQLESRIRNTITRLKALGI